MRLQLPEPGDLKQYVVSIHCARPLDAELAFVEYRKKILAMWSMPVLWHLGACDSISLVSADA